MSGGESESGDPPVIVRATEAVDELYRVRDTYFPTDPEEKSSRLQTLADSALSLLVSLPPGERKSPAQRAVCEFLKGKVLDAFPDYRKEAEDHLSKAVKLNPSLADAWLCLGNCIWKNGDLPSAKNCLSLALSKGPNKKILSQLSMLERRIAQDILGNACLTNFFVTGAWDHAKLQHSLKAYQNAEKDELMKSYPDLYYNCAIANKYLENYERALRGFEAAALKDPGLHADEEVQKIINLLDKLESLIRGQSRAKQLVSLVSSLSEVDLKLLYRKATINILTEGLNKRVAVVAKVLLFIKHDNIAPLELSERRCYYLLFI